MSQYERRRRSNVLSGDGSRLPNGGNTRVGQRGSGHLAAFSVCLGGRLDKTGTHANDGSRGEAVGKPGVARVYTNQRLNLSKPWEDLRMTSQGFKPGSGNPTVRHYRGALGNVRHGETETPSCNRKSGNGNPSPTAGRAQFLSQPSASCEARSAPRSYPTGGRATASGGPVGGKRGVGHRPQATAPTLDSTQRTSLCPVQVQNSRYLKHRFLTSKKWVLLRDGGAGSLAAGERHQTPGSPLSPTTPLGIAILRRVLW